MSWRAQMNERGVITRYKDYDTGEVLSAQEYSRRTLLNTGYVSGSPSMVAAPATQPSVMTPEPVINSALAEPTQAPAPSTVSTSPMSSPASSPAAQYPSQAVQEPQTVGADNPLVQPGARVIAPGSAASDMLDANSTNSAQQQVGTAQQPLSTASLPSNMSSLSGSPAPSLSSPLQNESTGISPSAGLPVQTKNLRLEGLRHISTQASHGPARAKGFLDATSIAILLPTIVLLALIMAAAHKKRLFPWQTVRTFNPPSGLMNPRDYERSYLCPPNLRRHGRLGKRNPNAAWTDGDGVVLPFGFLARTHLPVTIPMGRLPNKNMFIVAPSGSGKTTLMRAIIKALLAKPSVIIALEAKANDPNLDEKREGFKYTLLPEAQHAGFSTLYFNPLDSQSIHWNPLDLDSISFASSIIQDINSLAPEEQHWAERDHGYVAGLAQLLKWGAIQVAGEDENGQAVETLDLPCSPRGLMRLVNNRRNIVESLRRLKNNPDVDPGELSELTQTLTSIIRTDTDWDKNIQGVRGRLRMFKNPSVLRVTEKSNVDLRSAMFQPTVLIFGAPASLGPDAESLASCFVYQLQQALHTRYGTKNILPLFAFFDEYQTLNIDLAGRLSAIVRGANGGLTVILQNISQIMGSGKGSEGGSSGNGLSELRTIFSNSAVRVCLHNADESTAKFFSEEIGKHAVVVPGVSDHYMANGFGIFPTSWNRIHSQQVVARVDSDSIKRMEKHHALVYLSPAGDPEYGEVKPLMVDLRGIEEIARLHLLHNVQTRRMPPSPDGQPQSSGPSAPDGGHHGGGNGSGDSPSGGGGPSFIPTSPLTSPFGQNQAAAYTQMPASATAAASPLAGQPNTAQTEAALALRTCPSCSKPTGKGKFCISCGQLIGSATASGAEVEGKATAISTIKPAPTVNEPSVQSDQTEPSRQKPAAPPFPTFARPSAMQIADTAQQVLGTSAYQTAPVSAQPEAAAPAKGAARQPLTSFNVDPAKLGITPSGQANP